MAPLGTRAATSVMAATRSSDHPVDATLFEGTRDDQSLDLGRPFPDAIDTQLAEEALGRILAHVAAPAEYLDHAIGAAEGRLRCEQLGQRCLGVDDLAVRVAVG